MMKKAVITPVLIIIFSLSGCSKEDKNSNSPPPAGPAAVEVRTSVVEARDVERSVEATGTLLPRDETTVSNEIPGTIQRIFFDLGDRVKEGETLLILDRREAELNLEEAKALHRTNTKALEKERAKLEDARRTLKRYEELFKEGVVSTSQHDSAKTRFDVAEAEVKETEARVEQSLAKTNLAKKRLSDTVVKAPMSGEIKKRHVSTGETVKEKTGLFTIVSTETLKFRGRVAETFAPRIRPGQDVLLGVNAFRDKTFRGELKRISPAVDAETRTLEIEAFIPNPGGLLRPGFFARGTILTKMEKGVPFVPESAVYSFVGITKVFVIENNTAKEKIIKTGVRQNDMIEIIDGLKPGDIVATTNLSNLFDGAPVKGVQNNQG